MLSRGKKSIIWDSHIKREKIGWKKNILGILFVCHKNKNKKEEIGERGCDGWCEERCVLWEEDD